MTAPLLGRAVPVALLAALGLAGCGGASEQAASPVTSRASSASSSSSASSAPLPGDLFRRVRADALGADSVRVEGEVQRTDETLTVDLAGRLTGSNSTATLDYGDQGTAEIVVTGGSSYVRADRTYWTTQGGLDAAAARPLLGRYIQMSNAAATTFTADARIGPLLKGFFASDAISALESSTARVEKVDVSGKPAWRLSDPSGAFLVVRAGGRARLLQLGGSSDAPSRLTFSDWDQVARVGKPKGRIIPG